MSTKAVMLFITLVLVISGTSQAGEKSKQGSMDVSKGQTGQWTFDTGPVGGLPAGVGVFSGSWAVRAEADAPSPPNALCQTGQAGYPALALSDEVYGNVTVSALFKPISGTSDQAAGIIFRVQDRDNYYILRANALEDNVNFYKYVGGRRYVVQERSVKVASGKWQELRVEVQGDTIRGFLNGNLVVEARDDTFKTGKVGLWTKADSVICFDNVKTITQ